MAIPGTARLAISGVVLLGLLAVTGPVFAGEDQPAGNQPADAKAAPKTPEQVFSDLDKNGDGKLVASELPPEQQRLFERLLRVAGKDKGSELTKAEFLMAFKPDDLRVAAPQNLGGRGGNVFDPTQIFQRLDRNKDGKLTLDEVPEQAPGIRRLFKDLNKTELTREDVVQGAGRGGMSGRGALADPEGFFKRIDANQDGKLTAGEIPESLRPQFDRWLTALGKGKDDVVTADEFKKLVAENQAREGGPPGGNPEGMPRPGDGRGGFGALWLRKLDTNGDGKISKGELSKAVDLFDELDRDHDGFLEPAEMFGPPPEGRRPGAGGRPGGRPQPEAKKGPETETKPSSS